MLACVDKEMNKYSKNVQERIIEPLKSEPWCIDSVYIHMLPFRPKFLINSSHMETFSYVCAKGAFDYLERIDLPGQEIGDVGVAALARAIAPDEGDNTLPNIHTLDLLENGIGDAGMIALSGAFFKGSIPSLKVLILSYNRIGNDGLKALSDSLSEGALASGATVYLLRNNATEAGKQDMRDATKDCGRSVHL